LQREDRERARAAAGPADIIDEEEPGPATLAEALAGVQIPAGLGESFETLARVMARLRSPDGCPWDLEQTAEKLSRHLLEEAYETVDAIDSADWEHTAEELGDLMLQIVFQSRIAEEAGRFDLTTVVEGITEKLERRHPHIFAETEAETAEQVTVNWERIKREQEGKETAMSYPPGLPAIIAANKVQGHAAREGFDWTAANGVLEKLDEELEELEEARRNGGAHDEIEHEVGDLLFTVVNLARHFGIDPEQALRRSTREFVRRYGYMEEEARSQGRELGSMSLEEKERLWQSAKRAAR
jgi:tetrapyrrole methylase family protein/MazG family protein